MPPVTRPQLPRVPPVTLPSAARPSVPPVYRPQSQRLAQASRANHPAPPPPMPAIVTTSRPGGAIRIQAALAAGPVGGVELRSATNGAMELVNLRVEAAHRQHGIGSKLVQAAVQAAARQGASHVRLEARSSSDGIPPADLLRLYTRLGFKVVGRSARGSLLQRATGAAPRPELPRQPKGHCGCGCSPGGSACHGSTRSLQPSMRPRGTSGTVQRAEVESETYRGQERFEKAVEQGDLKLSEACVELMNHLEREDLRPKVSPHTKGGTGQSGTDHEKRNAAVAVDFKEKVLEAFNKKYGTHFTDCTRALRSLQNQSKGEKEDRGEQKEKAWSEQQETQKKQQAKSANFGRTKKEKTAKAPKPTCGAFHDRNPLKGKKCPVCGKMSYEAPGPPL